MLKLNIIPKALKKEMKLQATYIKLKNLLALFLLIALLYSISFVGSRIVMEMHAIETVHKTTMATKNQNDFSKQVRSINENISAVREIQSYFVEWSYLLEELMAKTSADITIKQLTTNKNTNILTIGGLARTRDDLLDFKDMLESSPDFTAVEFPIKNLLQKENINFKITAQITNYEFKD